MGSIAIPAGSSRELSVAATLCLPCGTVCDAPSPSPATTCSLSVPGSRTRMTLSPVSFPGGAGSGSTAAGSEKSET